MLLTFEADYHTHTWFSHGKGTIECNVLEAIRKNLKAIAVTDHSFAHPFVGMNSNKIHRMRRIVDDLNRRFQRDIRVLLGIEANIISSRGQIDVPRKLFPMFDILAVGLHHMVFMSPCADGWRINAANNLRWISGRLCELSRQINTQSLLRAMERYRVDIITHPGYCYPVNLPDLACGAAQTGTLLEINGSHGIPSAPDIRTAEGSGARFVAGSDAHRPDRVGCFGKAADIAAAAGIPSSRIVNAAGNAQWSFKSHEREETPCGS